MPVPVPVRGRAVNLDGTGPGRESHHNSGIKKIRTLILVQPTWVENNDAAPVYGLQVLLAKVLQPPDFVNDRLGYARRVRIGLADNFDDGVCAH